MKEERAVVRGTFSLPLLQREIVPDKSKREDVPESWPGVGDPNARAVVPITLLVTGMELAGPWLYSLRVPVYEAIDPETPVAKGYFSVDLLRLPSPIAVPQTYLIRAIHGQIISDPVKLALVTQDMLPKKGE